MRSVNLVFVALVVGASLTGGVAANRFGSELRTIDIIAIIDDQLGSNVTELTMAGDELIVTVRLSNPTGYAIRLRGTFVRVFDNGSQLAYGTGRRLDDGPSRLPPRGQLVARYAVGLTPDQSDRLRAAMESGSVRLNVVHSLQLRGESFELVRPNRSASGNAGP